MKWLCCHLVAFGVIALLPSLALAGGGGGGGGVQAVTVAVPLWLWLAPMVAGLLLAWRRR